MATNAKIDDLLSRFLTEQDIGILSAVFFDYGLKDYFNKACEYYKIKEFFGSFEAFSAIPRKDIVKVKDLEFYKICKNSALTYEGCVLNKLSYKEIQVALIYSLFKEIGFKVFIDEIHFSIKTNKQLSEEQIDELGYIMPKDTLKLTNDTYRTLMDVKSMFIYWCIFLDAEITDKIKKHHQKMPCISNEMCIDYIFTEIKKTDWKTRWGRLKAFNRNFYKLVENSRLEAIKYVNGV